MRRTTISLQLILALAITVSCVLWVTRASADNGSPITYHNGPVMAGTSNVYVIWYGNWVALTGPNSLDTQMILTNFLSEIGGSPRFQINATYPGVNGSPSGAIIFGGSESASIPHGVELDAAAIQSIVADNIGFARLPLDPNAIYLVAASSDIGSSATGFCNPNTPPHHGSFAYGGQVLKYAFIGNAARCPNIAAPQFFAPDGSQLPTPNGNLAADAMVAMTLHALDTAVTDPLGTGWFDGFGLENADKCQGSFSRTYATANGARANFTSGGTHSYLLRDNWVNNYGGYCSQYNDAPPRADNQTVQVNQDTTKSITLTAVDDNGDPLSFIIVTPPQHGTLTGSGATRTYTPANNFYGADSFTFKANDGTLDSTVATVSINVSTYSALDGFDPNANGLVRVAVVQPDGKILIGGDFTTLAPNDRLPVTRNYIARLNTDGTVDPTFNPAANSSIQAIALQPDGKIILGGDFNVFAPNGGASINRSNIARLNADGTIDPTFDPHPNGAVHAVAVQADGGIVTGGNFSGFNPGGGATVARNRIARMNPNGTIDPAFNPNANSIVDTLAVQPDGRILMGGRFTTLELYPGTGTTITRKYIARLNVNGTVDQSFDPNPDGIVGSVAVQPDGKVLLGGAFTALAPNDGSPIARNHLARMNVDGTLDTTFNPGPNSFVRAIVLQPDGQILIGGGFFSLAPNGGASVVRKYIARLNPAGTLETGFDASPSDQVFAIAMQSDGKIIVGGAFYAANSIRGQVRNRIARLEKDGRLDQSLNINTVGTSVTAAAIQPDGKILIAGAFNTVLGVARKNIARLNTDGTLDTTFNTGTNGYVGALAVQPDGKILIGGEFTTLALNGTSFVPNASAIVFRNRIARLNADGTVDLTFDPNADDVVQTLAVQPDGKILIGGFFTALTPNGGASVTRNVMARLNTDGTVDTAFNPSPNLDVYAIALQGDGKILVGGLFTALAPNGGASVPRNFIARVNSDGSLDNAFDPHANNLVDTFAVQSDGKLLLGGSFTTFAPNGGAPVSRNRIARLNVDGTVDHAFNPNANDVIAAITLQADGRILIGGSFTTLSPNGGTSAARNALARLNTDGSVDAFDPQPNNQVFAITLQADGKILLGGAFNSVGGQSRSLFARLANDTPAIQDLAVMQTTVTWARSGAEPQLSRVSFERSTDGVNYTLLGNGTRVGTSNDFTLAGQNLTVQQNLYIRARGFYCGGQYSSSESMTESVRNVFLPPALHLAFAQQPMNTPQNGAITPAVTVQILDASNNLVNSTAAITISLGNNPSSGTLAGTKTVAAVGGTATFNNLAVDKLGTGYTLNASATNLTGAVSNPFDVTVNAPSSIVATAGSGQSAIINSTFASALQARVTDVSGNPVNGVVVTFNAPANGSSGTFANNTTTTTATTDANGVANAASFTANGTAGLYSVLASINGGSTSTAFSLTNAKANQTINVTTHAPAGAVFNTQFNVAAASSSGLPVSYSSSGSCTNSSASFTMTSGTGACTVKYQQAGDLNHNAAPTVTETVSAQKAAQAITFEALADRVFGDSDFVVNASASSGLSPNFAAAGKCTANGSTVHLNGAGSCTITASQSGDPSFEAAPEVARSFIINKAGQTISFDSLANKTFGDSDFAISATTNSGLGVSFTTAGQCTVSGSLVHLTGAGSCTVTASQPGDANYNAATEVQRSFQIAKTGQTISFDAIANKTFGNPDFAVNASSSSGLSVVFAVSGQCTISGLNLHITAAGGCTITASQLGDANYNAAADVLRSFQINKATQTIVFDSLPDKTFGEADFVLHASSSSGLAVGFAASGHCTISGLNVHITAAGGCTITASQLGDANYNAATEVQRSFQIGKAGQTITFEAIPGKTFGDPDFQISASATSGRPVSFASSGQCANSGSNVHISGAGSCTITASEGGDANYNAATEVQRSFQIAKAGQTITFEAIPGKTFGDPDFQISASATSGRPVSFASSGQCVNSGPGLHITGAGSCTVTASEGGDENYNAAPDVARSFQISKASTTTALSSSTNPPAIGQNVTFTAAVTSGVGVPSGSVTFKYEGAAITSCSDLTLQSGSASCGTTTLSAGPHVVTAEYSGEANFEPSTGTLITEKLTGSVFEFLQASFGVAERGGFVTITVQRTGELSAPASVDYATDDGSVPSVAVGCSLVTGTALERCDYTRAAGTLQFAANETEKSFVVLVNDDSYVEGTETTSITLSNPDGSAALGPRATSTLQIVDDLAESFGNPSDDGATYVRQHYHDFLNREPDSEGLGFWTNNLAACDTDGCAEVKRIDTSAAFFLSIEFQETGYLVERFYKVAYGDATGASTFGGPHQLSVPIIRWREFLRDTQEIGNRVIVGQAAWQHQLEDQKQAFARGFIARARFRNAYPASLSAAQFVNQLNANTGGVLTNAEIMQLEEIFGGAGAGSADAAKRAQVLRTIAESQALQQQEFNRAFVLMQYFGYLRRNPDDAQDTDYTGYDFWLQKLERFGGNYVSAEMVKAFVSSIEYRQRFGQ